jgi:hypothetical protein
LFVHNKKPLVEKLGNKLKDVDSVFVDTASYLNITNVDCEKREGRRALIRYF